MRPYALAGLILAAGFVHAAVASGAEDAAFVDCTVPNAIGGTCPDAGDLRGNARTQVLQGAQAPAVAVAATQADHHKPLPHAAHLRLTADRSVPVHAP